MIPAEHISMETAAAWREKKLRPDQIVAMGEHLSRCEACRVLVSAEGADSRLATSLLGGDEHLDYESLEAIALGQASDDDLTLFNFHLSRCAVCAAELEGLRPLTVAEKAPASRWRIPVFAAGGLALAAAILLWLIPARKPLIDAPVQVVAALNDSGRAISLDASGGVRGLDGVSPGVVALAAAALRNGEIPSSSGAAGLSAGQEKLLGTAPPAEQIRSFVPAGSVVPGVTPHFSWDAPPNASRFMVSVYSTDFNPIVSSPELTSRDWTCSTSLKPGTTYIWTVSALIGGKRVTAPRSPEPEARFRVAAAAEADDWNSVQNLKPGSDLAQALTAARLAMYPEADAALKRLDAANVGSPEGLALVSKIRENLAASRQVNK